MKQLETGPSTVSYSPGFHLLRKVCDAVDSSFRESRQHPAGILKSSGSTPDALAVGFSKLPELIGGLCHGMRPKVQKYPNRLVGGVNLCVYTKKKTYFKFVGSLVLISRHTGHTRQIPA